MTTPKFSRREFMKGCCATAAVAGAPTMFYSSEANAANEYDTLVHVFLRGGIDGLNLVVPTTGNDRVYYEAARPNVRINATGDFSALPLVPQGGGSVTHGLHPSAVGLHQLWDERKLAIVHCCGLKTVVTRSHFDAQMYYDLGTPGQLGGGSGWLARAWETQPGITGDVDIPLMAVASRAPDNVRGSLSAISVGTPTDFSNNIGPSQWRQSGGGRPAALIGVNELLTSYVDGMSSIESDQRRAETSMRRIRERAFTSTLPAGWPTSTFARRMWTIAQSIRFNVGLRYTTLDLGGWDTHENQGTAGTGYHYYQNKIAELSQALTAFYNELATGGEIGRVTVVVQSEFGRRVRSNGSAGTDHGYGNPLLVLGGPVNGGRFYGPWSGLDPTVLQPYFGDLAILTDYRQVFTEILMRRMRNNRIGAIFPGYGGHTPLGIVQGTDMTPQYQPWAVDAAVEPAIARLPEHRQPAFGESLQAPARPASTDGGLRGGLRAANRRLLDAKLEAFRRLGGG